MSLCDRCLAPGECCKLMHLSNQAGDPSTEWVDGGFDGIVKSLQLRGLPFEPVVEIGRWTDEESGREYANYLYRCTKLLPNGRCGIYEDRPDLCRRYEPASDRLCVHYLGAESGDPTVDQLLESSFQLKAMP